MVDHIDEDKTNNQVNNLRHIPSSDNVKIRKYSETLYGKTSKRYKGVVEVYNLTTGEIIEHLRGSRDMRSKGYDPRNVSAVVLGKRSSYLGKGFRRLDDTLHLLENSNSLCKEDIPFIEVYDSMGQYLYTLQDFEDLVKRGLVLQRIQQFFSGKVKHHRSFTFKLNKGDGRAYNESS